MKKIYNKFIEWTLSVIAIVLYIPPIAIKLIIKGVIKIMQAIIFVVNEVALAIERVTEGLIERLSVKD